MSAEPRYLVVPHAYLDLRLWQVIDRQAAARRLPRVYETYRTEASARRCAEALNHEHASVAHYAGHGSCVIHPYDWVSGDVRRVTCQRCVDYIQSRIDQIAPRATTTEGTQS